MLNNICHPNNFYPRVLKDLDEENVHILMLICNKPQNRREMPENRENVAVPILRKYKWCYPSSLSQLERMVLGISWSGVKGLLTAD